MEIYDSIGRGYRGPRQADPRIAEQIERALGSARRVVNVGAGTGSYEPADTRVVAVEPSRVMLGQRPREAAPSVRATATALPFADDAFDAALAILTIHHWPDVDLGLAEMQRVARERVVLLTADPGLEGFWLLDYFPAVAAVDRAWMPTLEVLEQRLGACEISPVAVPHDCIDGFLGAYWRRPELYLDPDRRRAISVFSKIGDLEPGLAALRRDLESGAWSRRYGALLDAETHDIGYRLVVAHAA